MEKTIRTYLLLLFTALIVGCGDEPEKKWEILCSVGEVSVGKEITYTGWSENVRLYLVIPYDSTKQYFAGYSLRNTGDDLVKVSLINDSLTLFYKNDHLEITKFKEKIRNSVSINFQLCSTADWLKLESCAFRSEEP